MERDPILNVAEAASQLRDDPEALQHLTGAYRAAQAAQKPDKIDQILDAEQAFAAEEARRRAEEAEERRREEREQLGVLDDFGVEQAQAERSVFSTMPSEDVGFLTSALRQGTTFESAADFADVDERYIRYRGLFPKTQEDG